MAVGGPSRAESLAGKTRLYETDRPLSRALALPNRPIHAAIATQKGQRRGTPAPVETTSMERSPINRAAYSQILRGDTPEGRFLRRVPWVIDVTPQVADELMRELAAEGEHPPEGPLFSIITPLWNTAARLLEETILSVRCQSYGRWELLLVDDASPRREHLGIARRWAEKDPRIRYFELGENQGISGARNAAIEHASGRFLAFLDHDDLIHPSALSCFARRLVQAPETNLLFSNEAKISADSSTVGDFLTKPPFDRFTLLRLNAVCHFTAVRRDLLDNARVDGAVFRSAFDGCEDHDLFLRLAATGRVRAAHVPFFLYYWRTSPSSTARSPEAKPEAPGRRESLLHQFAARSHPGAEWSITPPGPGSAARFPSARPTRLVDRPRPTLLVLVRVHERAEWTVRALEALERQEHDLVVRVVLIAPDGVGPTLKRWLSLPRRFRYEETTLHHNDLLARHDDDLVLFLDGDVELRSPDALRCLALHLLTDQQCGLVGLRLMASDGTTVVHGGLRAWPRRVGAGHFAINGRAGARDFPYDEHSCFGVSLACAMARQSEARRLGGLDLSLSDMLATAIDLSARVREAGRDVHYFGSLQGTRHGNGPDETSERALSELAERHGPMLAAWRSRSLRLSRAPIWLMGPQGVRHRLRDRLADLLRRLLGPTHRHVRQAARGLMVRVDAARAPRGPRASTRPTLARRVGDVDRQGPGRRV